MDRGAWWATVHRVSQSQTRLMGLSMNTCIYYTHTHIMHINPHIYTNKYTCTYTHTHAHTHPCSHVHVHRLITLLHPGPHMNLKPWTLHRLPIYGYSKVNSVVKASLACFDPKFPARTRMGSRTESGGGARWGVRWGRRPCQVRGTEGGKTPCLQKRSANFSPCSVLLMNK